MGTNPAIHAAQAEPHLLSHTASPATEMQKQSQHPYEHGSIPIPVPVPIPVQNGTATLADEPDGLRQRRPPASSEPAPASSVGFTHTKTETETETELVSPEPISVLPRAPPRVDRLLYNARAAWFFFLVLACGTAIILLQLPSLLLLVFPYPLQFALPATKRTEFRRRFYRMYKFYIRWTESIFGSICTVIVSTLSPCKLVISGDVNAVRDAKQLVAMANHQIYPDWIYLWCFARLTNHHGDLKVMLMSVLKYIPILGIGMIFLEFIFLERKIAKDRQNIINMMTRQKKIAPDLPLWLLIFPEGTLNTPNNRETSRKFAKKTGITDDPKYVILPKATGLFMCCDVLAPKVTKLFDITVGYGGLNPYQIPYEEYLVENVYFAQQYPREVHLHIQEFDITKLPGFDGTLTKESLEADPVLRAEAEKLAATSGGGFDPLSDARRKLFSDWVRQRFMYKDQLMHEFYTTGAFPTTEVGVPDPRPLTRMDHQAAPEPSDWLTVIFGTAGAWYLAFQYTRWIWFLLGIVFRFFF
eukprot:jgi/Hompol1/5244/HPOL_000657-RA